MQDDFLPFALPDIGEGEIQAVTQALRSGWLSSGPKVREFEAAFAASLGGGVEAIAVNSATAGLHLALEALAIKPGDEVLVPTWTFTAAAEVVCHLGGVPILVDIEPDTLNLDLKQAKLRLTERTKAVLPVHFAGLPLNPAPLAEFASTHGLQVVEDAAHSFPAAAGSQIVGTGSSAATVFSFYATKTMTTGEGGMIVTRNTQMAERVRTMRLHGISRDAFDRYRSKLPAWHYEVVAAGYKYNLSDPAAAMGLIQLTRAAAMRQRRADIASAYDECLADTCLTLPAAGDEHVHHAWHLYVIRVPEGDDRDAFISRLAARGVGTSVHFIPLHMHPYWKDADENAGESFPVATREFSRVVSLPIYSAMTEESVHSVIRHVREVLA